MIELYKGGAYVLNGTQIVADTEEAPAVLAGKMAEVPSKEEARKQTIAYGIFEAHNTSGDMEKLKIRFDRLTSHDITFVGIIQTARASGLTRFPMPYVLTNCHNSLCAVGGTINEDDHMFGLTCAKKYGGVYVPPHQAVIHQYAREMLAGGGRMILGSDSHTRYGALGTMAMGEGGPELVKQLLGQTYDISMPGVVGVYLTGAPVVTVSEEVMDNTTRALAEAIDGFLPIEEINSWNSLAVNAENTALVQAFSDKVKTAHASYNTVTGEKQLELLGKDRVDRLLQVENALKSVKARFGISAKATTLTISSESKHKTKYAEGDLFDLTGLVIVVTYDDYSTETVNASSGEIKLTDKYDGEPLKLTNRYVEVTVRGVTAIIAIEVTEKGAEQPSKPTGKLNPAVIYGPIISVVAAAAIAVAVVFLIKKMKSAKSANGGSDNNGADNG